MAIYSITNEEVAGSRSHVLVGKDLESKHVIIRYWCERKKTYF